MKHAKIFALAALVSVAACGAEEEEVQNTETLPTTTTEAPVVEPMPAPMPAPLPADSATMPGATGAPMPGTTDTAATIPPSGQ